MILAYDLLNVESKFSLFQALFKEKSRDKMYLTMKSQHQITFE